jgi:hypothetical protein
MIVTSHPIRSGMTAGRLAGLLAVAGCAGGSGTDGSSAFLENQALGQVENPLILNVHAGVDDVWTESERVNISYCVSTDFGAYHERAVAEMNEATHDWEEAAYVDFIHASEHDGDCAYPTAPVVFTVESIFLGTGEAGSEGFPPSYVHEGQFHWLAIALPAYDTLDRAVDQRTSLGAFVHELGHILGFRHEHVRPEATQAPFAYDCFDEPVSEGSDPWRTIAGAEKYDPNSALHYGTGSCGPLKDFVLTETDRAAAHSVYPSPTRCEVWAGSTQLAVTDIAPPASAVDAEGRCEAFAIDVQQEHGLALSTLERQADHVRALLVESPPTPESDTPDEPDTITEVDFRTAARSKREESRRHWNGASSRRKRGGR